MNYKYTSSNLFEYELLFELDSYNHITKIKFIYNSGADILSFEPRGDRKTVIEILNEFAPDFSTITDNGWLNSNDFTYRLYKDANHNEG